MTWRHKAVFVAAVLTLGGCNRQGAPTAAPAPVEITDDAVGHYCGMGLNEHSGPKGQIFVADRKDPYWFSSVRDAFAFTRLPEEPRNITAIYVNDMAKARNWDRPEPGTWIDAKRAWFVIGSKRRGGMDVNEAVPFGAETKAKDFVAENGGRIVRFDGVPDDYIFPSADVLPGKSNSKMLKE